MCGPASISFIETGRQADRPAVWNLRSGARSRARCQHAPLTRHLRLPRRFASSAGAVASRAAADSRRTWPASGRGRTSRPRMCRPSSKCAAAKCGRHVHRPALQPDAFDAVLDTLEAAQEIWSRPAPEDGQAAWHHTVISPLGVSIANARPICVVSMKPRLQGNVVAPAGGKQELEVGELPQRAFCDIGWIRAVAATLERGSLFQSRKRGMLREDEPTLRHRMARWRDPQRSVRLGFPAPAGSMPGRSPFTRP